MVLFCAMLLYSILAMRRVFQMGWPLTLIKAFAVFIVYVSVLGATMGLVFIYAALQL